MYRYLGGKLSLGMEGMFEATLCFVTDDTRVLLIEKKRGPGAGFYNAPGGKINPGESPREAAAREVREETGVEVRKLAKAAELDFMIGGDPFSSVHVYTTATFEGVPLETDEATPEWFAVTDLPFDDMWAGDQYWVPRVLAGESITGTVWFDPTRETVVDYSFTATSFPPDQPPDG